jgi:3-hydroxybutyryl-CoA dehydrogenase
MSAFRCCAVIGTGLMGPQIAVALAAGAERVRIYDTDPAALERALAAVHTYVAELTKHELLEPSAAENFSSIIETATELGAAVSEADIVVEAIYENVDAKREIFRELDAASDPATILASNTSSIPIRLMAEVCRRPERVVGTHFALPAHIVPLVEVIRHPRISDDCFDRTFQALIDIKKLPIRVNLDVPGFVANRLQHSLTRQAIELVVLGVASPEDVDNAVRYGFGLRFTSMGPLAVRDISGLMNHARVAELLYGDLDAEGDLAIETLREHSARGDDGLRTGRGFFEWGENAEAIRAYHYESMIEQTRRVVAEGPMKTDVQT